MSLKKTFLKSKPICKVRFELPKEAADAADSVNLVGDFNDWDALANPMKKLKSGIFTTTIDLAVENEYQFRYLIDQIIWENDWEADNYVPSPYGGSENSVVAV